MDNTYRDETFSMESPHQTQGTAGVVEKGGSGQQMEGGGPKGILRSQRGNGEEVMRMFPLFRRFKAFL